jgi:ketosteroid isomerase-like protein
MSTFHLPPRTPMAVSTGHSSSSSSAAAGAPPGGDAVDAARFYTDDALLLPPDGRVLRGRPAVQAFWAAGAGTRLSNVSARTLAAGGSGGLAYLAGEYDLTATPPGGAPAAARGTFLLVFRRDQGA